MVVRDESVLLFFSPIFLSSNSFLFYLLCSIFCSRKSFLLTLFTLNLVVMSICPYKIRLPSLKIMLKSKLHSQGCNKIIFLASINCKDDTVATEVSCLSTQFFSWVYFAPIMPAFCSLLFLSYYSKNFAGRIDSSLLTSQTLYS